MKSLYFKDWITGWDWGVRIALFILLMTSLVQLGMFVLTQNYLVSYLGAQPEDISFAVMCTYAGIITVIPLQFRFFRYFQTRSYLIVSLMLAVLFNSFCIYCQDINLFLFIRFLQGIVTGNVIVITLQLIFTRLPVPRVKIIAPAIFYGAILSNTVLIGLLSGIVVESSDWKVSYHYLILCQLLTLLIVLLVLKRKSVYKPYPLYQIDWTGMPVFAFSALMLAYTIIYGSKYYWFADRRICYSTLATVIGGCMFLYRQHLLKRPVLHLKVFRSGKFLIGICLLGIYYGSKDSVNLIYNYAGGILKWSTLQVMELACCNILGMVLLLVLCIRLLLAQKVVLKVLFVIGFALMGAVNLWMSFFLTPDLSFIDLLVPVFILGIASGILFVPLMIYVLSSVPADTGISALVIAACTRFTATSNSFAGFYNLQLYFNQKFREGFLNYLNVESTNVAERLVFYKELFSSKGFAATQVLPLAHAAVWQNLNLQSQLLTNRAIFMCFGLMLMGIALLIVIVSFIRKMYSLIKREA